jgi:hypothetical protein
MVGVIMDGFFYPVIVVLEASMYEIQPHIDGGLHHHVVASSVWW